MPAGSWERWRITQKTLWWTSSTRLWISIL